MEYGFLVKLAELFAEAANRTDYMRVYMAKRYHNKMNAMREALGNKCNSCGTIDGPFHIDHINASKKTMRASDIHSTSDARVQEEMKNFQLLCSGCHKNKTHEEWDYSTPKPRHGTYWYYRKYKCRCNECETAYKEKIKEWKERKNAKK